MKSPLPGILKNQRVVAGALLLSLCLGAYSKSAPAMDQTAEIDDGRCTDPREALKQNVQISAGGPYFARVGAPITLHGTYSIAGQTENSEHLKIIGQAIQDYAKDHGSYPPAALLNAAGKPTVSWRVLLLPYLGEKALYDRFDLTKPWNEGANLHLLREMPAVYRKSEADNGTETGFAGVQGSNSLFQNASTQLSGGHPLNGITASEKIAAGPVGADVHLPWTAPGDIEISKATQLGSAYGFSGEGHDFTPLLFLNGMVFIMPNNVGTPSMITWTHIASSNGVCPCAPPSSVDAGLQAKWDLGINGTSNTQGFNVTFLAHQPGKYTVTLHGVDHYGHQYQTSTTVHVQ